MLQSLATLAFLATALLAAALIAALIRADWETMRAALGLLRAVPATRLPPRMRLVPAVRAEVVRVTLADARRAA